jgi:nicotinamide phosphoribosyltransferase
MNPILLTDFYKVNHQRMYPEGMTMLYSNFTPRKSRIDGVEGVVVFGLQHFIKEYLIKAYNEEFFSRPLAHVIAEYKQVIDVDTAHIEALHKLGYLPIYIKALPEGSFCPIGVPLLTIRNTHPDFGWLTNYLETLISTMIWQPITSATIALMFKKIITKYALLSTGTAEGVAYQAHDFSMRGMSSVESAITSGMAHLAVGFTGTDNIPAIYQAMRSYGSSTIPGGSVPATEHSVMCMGTKDDEIGTFRTLLNKYPSGFLSVVSDTWDLWKVCTEFLPILKDEIMARDGRLVIRPDSGDPVDIICGTKIWVNKSAWETYNYNNDTPEKKGVIELLWDVFGGTVNEQGYKVLDSHIGAIYGDGMTPERVTAICERLMAKGFASSNVVFGLGSFTYQYNTRDTFGFAMKATAGEVNGVFQEIFKDPITDDGTKRSAKGLLRVDKNFLTNGEFYLEQQQDWTGEQGGELIPVFEDSELLVFYTLDEIRERTAHLV